MIEHIISILSRISLISIFNVSSQKLGTSTMNSRALLIALLLLGKAVMSIVILSSDML